MTIEDILFDKDYLTISYKPEHKLIHMKWKGFASSENFRDGLTFTMETARDLQAENVLANLKLMQVILPQDEEWATQVWFPKLAQISLKKLGIVTSLDYFNNTSIKRMLNTAMPFINFETRYFVDVDQAREWLKSNH